MNRVVSGDVSAMKALCSHREDVTGFYGWGAYEKGWPAVSRRWDWAGEQFRGGGPVTYETLTTVGAGEPAYATQTETSRVRRGGAAGGAGDPTSSAPRRKVTGAGFTPGGPRGPTAETGSNKTATEELTMAPTPFRSGDDGTSIRFAVGESALGSILVATTDRGVCAILLGDARDALARDLQERFPEARLFGGDE